MIPLIILLTLGCGAEETPFPPGVAPLEENLAPEPEGEEVAIVAGEADDYRWAHARGRVRGSVSETWAAFKVPEVVVDRRRIDAWETTYDVEPDADFSMTIHQVIHEVVTVEYDLTWRQEGVDEDVVGIRWQKTLGSPLVDILRGSVVIRRLEDDLVEIEVVEHLGAPSTREEDLTGYLADLHASVVAHVHGDPLPEYTR